MFSQLKLLAFALVMFTSAIFGFITYVKAQPNSPGQGGFGNMMGEGWGMGWGMWGFGWFGVLAICLLVLGVIVFSLRLKK